MLSLFKKFLDILFPKEETALVLESLAEDGNLRSLTQAPKNPLLWAHALFSYRDPRVKKLVWEIKYKASGVLTEVVSALLVEEIISALSERSHFISSDWILVAIPSSADHLKEKGFNQADLVCRAIIESSLMSAIAYEPTALTKVRTVKAQTSMKSKKERESNMQKSLRADKSVSGKNVIIVDDVITTGATLKEAKRALKDAGAKEVWAFAIAH